MSEFKFELGARVKDQITGFEGVITDRSEHLTGVNTYGVNPQVIQHGKPVAVTWFDEGRLQVSEGRGKWFIFSEDGACEYNYRG